MDIERIIQAMKPEDQTRCRMVRSYLKNGGSPSLSMVRDFLKEHHLTPYMLCPERYPRPEPLTPDENPTITNMRAVGLVDENQPVERLPVAGVKIEQNQAIYVSRGDGLIYPVNPTREQMEQLKNKRMRQQEEIRLEDIPF